MYSSGPHRRDRSLAALEGAGADTELTSRTLDSHVPLNIETEGEVLLGLRFIVSDYIRTGDLDRGLDLELDKAIGPLFRQKWHAIDVVASLWERFSSDQYDLGLALHRRLDQAVTWQERSLLVELLFKSPYAWASFNISCMRLDQGWESWIEFLKLCGDEELGNFAGGALETFAPTEDSDERLALVSESVADSLRYVRSSEWWFRRFVQLAERQGSDLLNEDIGKEDHKLDRLLYQSCVAYYLLERCAQEGKQHSIFDQVRALYFTSAYGWEHFLDQSIINHFPDRARELFLECSAAELSGHWFHDGKKFYSLCNYHLMSVNGMIEPQQVVKDLSVFLDPENIVPPFMLAGACYVLMDENSGGSLGQRRLLQGIVREVESDGSPNILGTVVRLCRESPAALPILKAVFEWEFESSSGLVKAFEQLRHLELSSLEKGKGMEGFPSSPSKKCALYYLRAIGYSNLLGWISSESPTLRSNSRAVLNWALSKATRKQQYQYFTRPMRILLGNDQQSRELATNLAELSRSCFDE